MDRATVDRYESSVPRDQLPLALAELHRTLAVGAPLDLRVAPRDSEDLGDVIVGAGFTAESIEVDGDAVRATCRRAATLADTVGPGMRLLVCGLNPSIYSAERGVGYARPGNRFWKAVVAAGLVGAERALDPAAALRQDGIGMTDLAKRATVASAELSADEYREGAARVERLVHWLRPAAVCSVGLEGWRAAVERRAVAGPQVQPFGGRPVYLLPSTSGLNAHSRLDDLVDHFRAAGALADRSR